MNSESPSERLSLLKTETDRLLRSYACRAGPTVPRPGEAPDGRRSDTNAAVPMPLTPLRGTGESPDTLTVNVNLFGAPIFLDDERRIRALAKEIKRLINEDRRRGLGVGG